MDGVKTKVTHTWRQRQRRQYSVEFAIDTVELDSQGIDCGGQSIDRGSQGVDLAIDCAKLPPLLVDLCPNACDL
jgi:hypothetical protein